LTKTNRHGGGGGGGRKHRQKFFVQQYRPRIGYNSTFRIQI